MNTLLVASLIALSWQGSGPQERPITLNFSETDVAQIFRVIGLRTNANIIYSGGEKKAVSISYNAESTEDAVRAVATAAGLAYRRVGGTYIVAAPTALRSAILPFTQRLRVATPLGIDVEAYFAKVLPDVTVVSSSINGTELLGVPDDLAAAARIVEALRSEQDKIRQLESRKGPLVTEVVTLTLADPFGVTLVLQSLYPDVRVISLAGGASVRSSPLPPDFGINPANPQAGTGTTQTPANQGTAPANTATAARGGTLTLIGKREDVAAAKAKAIELDASVSSLGQEIAIVPYEIRFGSPRSIIAFLAQVAPEVQVSLAPSAFSPLPLQQTAGASSNAQSATANTGGNGQIDPETLNGLGQKPTVVDGRGVTSTEVDVSADRARRVVLKGRPSDVQAAIRVLQSVDVEPPQVVVDVRVYDMSPEVSEQIGAQYSFRQMSLRELPPGTYTNPLTLENAFTNTLRSPGLGILSRTGLGIDAILDAQRNTSDIKILARPSVQVLDNEEANFFIGDTINYPAPTSGALGTQNVEILQFSVGIGLRVRPRINPDGKVTMVLNPFVSTITGISNGLPQTSTREANTTVLVADGDTLVLSGLIRDEERRTLLEVPILSKIPIIGQLFRYTNQSRRRSNIIVTLTPRVVKSAAVQGRN